MSEKGQPDDNTRRTFLQLVGVMGTATAGLGTLSSSAAADTTSTDTMKKLDLTADNLVPDNKYVSFLVDGLPVEQIEKMNVLVDETPVSNMQMYKVSDNATGGLLNVFELVTNHGLPPGKSVPIQAKGTTTSGESFVAKGVTSVVDPANLLGEGQFGGSELTAPVDDTVSDVTGTVDSTGVLGKPSSKRRRQQMY